MLSTHFFEMERSEIVMTADARYLRSASLSVSSVPYAFGLRQTNHLPSPTVNVPNNWVPLPVRQRESCAACSDGRSINPVILTRCLPPSSMVAGNLQRAVLSRSLNSGEHIEYFLPAAHSSPVVRVSRHSDFNANEPYSSSSTACCCPRALSGAASSRQVHNERICCSSALAKDCWQRLCNRACCVGCLSFATFKSFHCLLLLLASLGVGCIISGVVLGILRMAVYGSFLVLSVMFVGKMTFLFLLKYYFQFKFHQFEGPLAGVMNNIVNGMDLSSHCRATYTSPRCTDSKLKHLLKD